MTLSLYNADSAAQSIWVYLERDRNGLAGISLELLAKGRQLADQAGWVLGGILILAGTSGTAWHGAYLLAIYSLGLGLPFLIIGVAFDAVSPLLKRIGRYSTAIYIASGVVLIIVGILILTNKLVFLSGI